MRLLPRAIRIGVIVVVVLTVGVVALGVLGTLIRVGGKSSAPHDDRSPRRTGLHAEPILQLENHTCGLLSLSAAYVAYGLSPEAENLRFRLGTDREAVPGDSTTTGTLHPDLLRVLAQDGFGYDLIDPTSSDANVRLRGHVEGGNVALLLIARRQNGALHWVMSDTMELGSLRVVDSLLSEPVTEDVEVFLRDCVLSIIAIRPEGDASITRAHADGIAEMARVRERMKASAKRS